MITPADVLREFPGARLVTEPRRLRPYQEKAVEDVRRELQAGRSRVCLQMPVGSGKTDVAGFMVSGAHNRSARVLFVAHRKELVDNAVARLALWGIREDEMGVIRADDVRTNAAAPVQVASIASLSRRATITPPPTFIIIDECHRVRSDSYMQLLTLYPDAIFVGLTASPLRTDGRGLDSFFDSLVVGPRPSSLIAEGHLARPRVFTAPIQVQVTREQLNTVDELGEVMSAPRLVGNVVAEWKRVAGNRQTFCFAASVEHSKRLNERFLQNEIPSAHVDGSSSPEAREQAFVDLGSGRIRVLCNYGVAIEGIDITVAKCAIVARPTSSLVVWIQSTGRVLRPHNDITPIVLDHGGNTERLGSCFADREWTLTGGGRCPTENLYRVCPSCFAYVTTTKPCELCGAVSETKTAAEIEADESIRLEEIIEATENASDEEKKRFYFAMVEKCRRLAWQVSAASYAYRSKYNQWRPQSWFEEAQRMLEKDDNYYERLGERRRKKENQNAQ